MARKGKGVVMGHPCCDWVRERLSLLVGDSNGLAGEGGDVPGEDRTWIEHHLVQCASCRDHRAGLEQAMAILGSAAAEPWNGPATPSIWPELEVQIQHRGEQPRPTWQRFVTAICPERLRLAANHLAEVTVVFGARPPSNLPGLVIRSTRFSSTDPCSCCPGLPPRLPYPYR